MSFEVLPSLDSLRCFVEVATRLNFRAAARAVALTPGAVSLRIRGLEDQLGVPLFLRTTRSVALTEAGEALLPEARAVLALTSQALRRARGALGPAPVELTLGTRHELGMSWVLPALPHLERALPHVTLHLFFGSGPELLTRVSSGQITGAIGSMRHTDASLVGLPLHEERYVLVGAKRLLARHPLRRPAQAAAHRLLDIDPTRPLARYLEAAPGEAEVTFGPLRCLGTISAVRALVLRGEGVAVLPEYLVHADLAAGKLQRLLPGRPLRADAFRLLVRAKDPRLPLYERLAAALRELPLR